MSNHAQQCVFCWIPIYMYSLLMPVNDCASFHNRKDHAKCEFAVHDVFAVDILISTGEGKTKEKDSRTTVYKRTDNVYSLKMKASRGEGSI